MSSLEKIPEKQRKWTDFQKDYNQSSKTLMNLIGTNISLFVCLLLPFVLIGFIWTDFGPLKIDLKFISDGIVTVALIVIGETMMMRVGATGGKLDPEYLAAKSEYDRLVNTVTDVGTMLMSLFCEWQKTIELDKAVSTRLRYLRFTGEDWDRVKKMPRKEIYKTYGKNKAQKILELNQIEPVELTDAMLLFDGSDTLTRGGVPIGGEEYINKKSHSVMMLLSSIFTGLLTVSVALTLTSDISFARVMYTAFKLVVLLFRMAQGYDIGAKAYNTIEVKQLKTKNNYLRQYIRFINEKTYLKLSNEYRDFCHLIDVEEPKTEEPKVEEFETEEPKAEMQLVEAVVTTN